VGTASAAATAIGPRRERDVEYDRACLGILEQQHLDPALTARGVFFYRRAWRLRHVDQSATTAISLPRR
jgi:hypothetical protein